MTTIKAIRESLKDNNIRIRVCYWPHENPMYIVELEENYDQCWRKAERIPDDERVNNFVRSASLVYVGTGPTKAIAINKLLQEWWNENGH